MIDVLLLRFDAPLMSFGTTAVDSHRVVQAFPALSMLTGLLGNALGYDHREAEKLTDLQERIRYASRCDRAGSHLVDFQTVGLGQPFLTAGWTTRGTPEGRGGASGDQTHIRYRHYQADAVHTVALTLGPGMPGLDEVERALRTPERPLFIGRKACLPSGPILLERLQAESLRAALENEPRVPGGDTGALQAWWPADEETPAQSHLVEVVDERDWRNQIHSGRRLLREGMVEPACEVSHGD